MRAERFAPNGKLPLVSYARFSPELDSSASGEMQAVQPERDLAAALHEVSNALTVVLGWLDEAREASVGNARAEQALDVALSRARLGRDLARRAIGAATPSGDEETELATLVRDAVHGVEREASRKAVSIVVSVASDAEGARVRDAGAALQILTNLLLNAIAMGSGNVKVETAVWAGEARVAVIDDGPGVESSRRATIFDGGPSSRPGGAGIGLRHAHALASSKGGALELGEGDRGARFELSWPLAEPRSGPMRPSARSSSLAGLRVLVLDDDDAVLELLATALSVRGAEVASARTAAELERVEAARFDVALLDLSPLGGSVAASIARVRERSPDAKVVVISGSAGGLPDDAAALASAWVRKPFEVAELLAVVGDVLAHGTR